MKEFLVGIWSLLWAIMVSVILIPIGLLYSFGYSIWLTITMKKPLAFFKFWWRLVDGFMASIGHILLEVAYGLDLSWNVNGEILEDVITTEEKTHFTEKNVSVSATTGDLEIRGKLNKMGLRFTKLLNFFFNQKQHAIDSWNYLVAKEELKKDYFSKRKS